MPKMLKFRTTKLFIRNTIVGLFFHTKAHQLNRTVKELDYDKSTQGHEFQSYVASSFVFIQKHLALTVSQTF